MVSLENGNLIRSDPVLHKVHLQQRPDEGFGTDALRPQRDKVLFGIVVFQDVGIVVRRIHRCRNLAVVAVEFAIRLEKTAVVYFRPSSRALALNTQDKRRRDRLCIDVIVVAADEIQLAAQLRAKEPPGRFAFRVDRQVVLIVGVAQAVVDVKSVTRIHYQLIFLIRFLYRMTVRPFASVYTWRSDNLRIAAMSSAIFLLSPIAFTTTGVG